MGTKGQYVSYSIQHASLNHYQVVEGGSQKGQHDSSKSHMNHTDCQDLRWYETRYELRGMRWFKVKEGQRLATLGVRDALLVV